MAVRLVEPDGPEREREGGEKRKKKHVLDIFFVLDYIFYLLYENFYFCYIYTFHVCEVVGVASYNQKKKRRRARMNMINNIFNNNIF